MENPNKIYFAPQIYIKSGVRNIEFYSKAFGARELRRWPNKDGTVHVAELSVGDAIFHLHEVNTEKGHLDPQAINGSTVTIGLFVPDVDLFMNKAKAAGAIEVSPAQSYNYGYRQGLLKDPFGHFWLIEMKIEEND